MAEKTSIPQKLAKGEALNAWRQFKDEYPAAYTAAAVLPVTGQAAAVADYAQATDEGNRADGVTAAASFIPGFKLGKMASKLAPPALRLASKMTTTEKAIAPLVKHAPTIGKVAAAEQLSEYAVAKLKNDKEKARDDDEFAASWRDNP